MSRSCFRWRLKLGLCMLVYYIHLTMTLDESVNCILNATNVTLKSCKCFTFGDKKGVKLFCEFSDNIVIENKSQIIAVEVTHLEFRGPYSMIALDVLEGVLTNVTHIDVQGSTQSYTLTNGLLSKFPRLEELRLHRCNISDIEVGAFRNSSRLLKLDISGNSRLSVDSFVGGLENHTMNYLEILNISGIYNVKDTRMTTIRSPFMKYLSRTKLRVLDVSWTRIDTIEESMDSLYLLNEINLSGTYLTGTKLCMATLLFLKQLKTVIVDFWPEIATENQSINYIEDDIERYQKRSLSLCPFHPVWNPNTRCWYVPESVETFKIRHINLRSLYAELNTDPFCLENNNVVNFLIADSSLPDRIGSFRGFYKLKYLDISRLKPEFKGPVIKADMFWEMPNVEVLKLASCRLNEFSEQTQSKMFIENRYLRHLDISDNNLRTIPFSLLEKNIHLEHLNMSGNELIDVHFNISGVNLHTIDISNNRIESVSNISVEYFEKLSKNHPIRLYLEDNNIVCSCNWLKLTRLENVSTSIECTYNEQSFHIGHTSTTVPDEILNLCEPVQNGPPLTTIIAVSISALVLLVIIVIFGVRRWKSQTQNGARKFPLVTLPYTKAHRNTKRKFIVFLAYCFKDYSFAFEKLYPRLNKKLKTMLKIKGSNNIVIVNDQHFLPGKQIDELITSAIHESCVTVAVISNDFLESSWCRFEILKSFNDHVPVIPLYISPCEPSKLHGVLKELYNTRVRILWPNDPSAGKETIDAQEEKTVELLCRSIAAHVAEVRQSNPIENTEP